LFSGSIIDRGLVCDQVVWGLTIQAEKRLGKIEGGVWSGQMGEGEGVRKELGGGMP
jgi:hypothetical protein